jgi:hypothetical protein
LVDFTRPADSLEPGLTPAHDARCAAVGNWVMSPPVSAMKISARTWEKPGMLSSRSRAGRKGLHQPVDPLRQQLNVLGVGVDPVQEQAPCQVRKSFASLPTQTGPDTSAQIKCRFIPALRKGTMEPDLRNDVTRHVDDDIGVPR